MIGTYLVQRLNRKPRTEFDAKVSQVFGGVALELKPEAWKLLQNVFDFDYMGAAEYEFGAIPKTLHQLAIDNRGLISFEMTLTREDVKVNPDHKFIHQRARDAEIAKARKAGKKPTRAKPFKPPAFDPKTVYVICRARQREGVEAHIKCLAQDTIHTKCGHYFNKVLDPSSDSKWHAQTIGWLELDNGFFFFIDKESFEGTKTLFGVK
jgi:hypothetical protein